MCAGRRRGSSHSGAVMLPPPLLLPRVGGELTPSWGRPGGREGGVPEGRDQGERSCIRRQNSICNPAVQYQNVRRCSSCSRGDAAALLGRVSHLLGGRLLGGGLLGSSGLGGLLGSGGLLRGGQGRAGEGLRFGGGTARAAKRSPWSPSVPDTRACASPPGSKHQPRWIQRRGHQCWGHPTGQQAVTQQCHGAPSSSSPGAHLGGDLLDCGLGGGGLLGGGCLLDGGLQGGGSVEEGGGEGRTVVAVVRAAPAAAWRCC